MRPSPAGVRSWGSLAGPVPPPSAPPVGRGRPLGPFVPLSADTAETAPRSSLPGRVGLGSATPAREGEEEEVSPRAGTRPRPPRPPPPPGASSASRPSPTDPALRANPYPEVTDPACRLPLPTLFQHARGCSPWRPAADMGTARREIYTLSPGFSRAGESSPDAAGTATLSKARAPLSGRTHSRAPCPSRRKENSPRGSRRLLRDRSRYRTGRLAAPVSATPDSGI